MNITILDDYASAVRGLQCFSSLAGHEVTIWNDYTNDVNVLAERLKDTEILVLLRERTAVRAPLRRPGWAGDASPSYRGVSTSTRTVEKLGSAAPCRRAPALVSWRRYDTTSAVIRSPGSSVGTPGG